MVRIKDQIWIQDLLLPHLLTFANRVVPGKGSCGNHLLRWNDRLLQMRIDASLNSLYSLNSSRDWSKLHSSSVSLFRAPSHGDA